MTSHKLKTAAYQLRIGWVMRNIHDIKSSKTFKRITIHYINQTHRILEREYRTVIPWPYYLDITFGHLCIAFPCPFSWCFDWSRAFVLHLAQLHPLHHASIVPLQCHFSNLSRPDWLATIVFVVLLEKKPVFIEEKRTLSEGLLGGIDYFCTQCRLESSSS